LSRRRANDGHDSRTIDLPALSGIEISAPRIGPLVDDAIDVKDVFIFFILY